MEELTWVSDAGTCQLSSFEFFARFRLTDYIHSNSRLLLYKNLKFKCLLMFKPTCHVMHFMLDVLMTCTHQVTSFL